ncbi:hypothetical protein G6F65_011658 [Rhizopus arrhizus]|nr:hypothetical protein G6F65_011658 [Rhizopus arrhizus]
MPLPGTAWQRHPSRCGSDALLRGTRLGGVHEVDAQAAIGSHLLALEHAHLVLEPHHHFVVLTRLRHELDRQRVRCCSAAEVGDVLELCVEDQRLAGLHRILLEVRVREQDAFHRTHGVGFRHSDGNVLRAAAHQAAYGCAVAARDHDFPSRVATALATDMHGDAAAVGTEDADAGAIAGGQGSSNGAGRRCGAHRGRKRFWQTRDESRHALLGQLVGHAPHFGIVIRLPLWQRSGLRAIGAVNGHGR